MKQGSVGCTRGGGTLSGGALMQGSITRRCTARKRQPPEVRTHDDTTAAQTQSIGKATWKRLLELGLVKEQTRCNVIVLGVATRLHSSR